MKNFYLFLIFLCLFNCSDKNNEIYDVFIQSGKYQGEYWPTENWRSCHPEEVGMKAGDLYGAYEYALQASFQTHGLLIIRKGYIVGEFYDANSNENARFPSYSVAKSVLSALIGIAIDDDKISSVDDLARDYLLEWNGSAIDSRKKQITIRHLLGMASGISWNEDYSDSENDINKMVNTRDYLTFMLDKDMDHDPFEYWEYNTGNSVLLSGILQEATGKTAFNYGKEKLFTILGMEKITWDSDPSGLTVGGWGIRTTVQEYARFGYLYLNNGNWDGQQVVPSNWVTLSATPLTVNIDYYGLHWWILQGFGDFSLPEDIFLAIGIHGQLLYILPSHDIVIAKFSSNADPLNSDWDHDLFLSYIMDSLK